MYTEFLAALILAYGTVKEERIAEAFDEIDTTNTGYISPINLETSLSKGSDSRFRQESLIKMFEEVNSSKDGKSKYCTMLYSCCYHYCACGGKFYAFIFYWVILT